MLIDFRSLPVKKRVSVTIPGEWNMLILEQPGYALPESNLVILPPYKYCSGTGYKKGRIPQVNNRLNC